MELSLPAVLGVMAAGIAVGIFSALFGVGGGLVMVPFIVLALDEPQHIAEGTSLLAIVPTALAGVFAHGRRGFVSFPHAGFLALGGIAGALTGALLAHEIDPTALQRLFGVFVIAMGIRIIVEGARG